MVVNAIDGFCKSLSAIFPLQPPNSENSWHRVLHCHAIRDTLVHQWEEEVSHGDTDRRGCMMLPQRFEGTTNRVIQVTRSHLARGGMVTRSLWVKISPRNPLLKLVLLPPMVLAMVVLLILMLVALGFILLAMALMWAISIRKPR